MRPSLNAVLHQNSTVRSPFRDLREPQAKYIAVNRSSRLASCAKEESIQVGLRKLWGARNLLPSKHVVLRVS